MPPAAVTRRGGLALLFLGLCGVFGFFAHGYVENTDGEVTLHAARAWWLRGDPGLLPAGEDTSAAERWIAAQILAERPSLGLPGRNGRAYVWFPIGHQLLLVPCVALGECLDRVLPDAEQRFAATQPPLCEQFFWARFLASFVPAIAAAGAAIALLLLARTVGAAREPRSSRGEALLVAAVAVFATQVWPGGSEALSDAPGMCFLLFAALFVYRSGAGLGSRFDLLAGGACAGAAVLLRYPHALPVAILAILIAVHARRTGRWSALGQFVLGGLPFAAALLAANWLRFGSLLETGYSAGARGGWASYPPWLGVPLVLLAPGKGILWFSPPLWPALRETLRRDAAGAWRALRFPVGPALAILVATVLAVGRTHGWGAGQCWGIRYLTPAIALFVVVSLAATRPWRRYPRTFAAVCGLGLVVSLGGVLAPYRGQQQLAFTAAETLFADELARGDFGPELLLDRVNFLPRFSPLHSHWTYAVLSASGRLAAGGSANTTEPLFGVAVKGPVALAHVEDSAFRHWWMPWLHHLLGMPLWPVLLAWWAVTAALLVTGCRRWLVADATLDGPVRG